jgi:hypothetical protein
MLFLLILNENFQQVCRKIIEKQVFLFYKNQKLGKNKKRFCIERLEIPKKSYKTKKKNLPISKSQIQSKFKKHPFVRL